MTPTDRPMARPTSRAWPFQGAFFAWALHVATRLAALVLVQPDAALDQYARFPGSLPPGLSAWARLATSLESHGWAPSFGTSWLAAALCADAALALGVRFLSGSGSERDDARGWRAAAHYGLLTLPLAGWLLRRPEVFSVAAAAWALVQVGRGRWGTAGGLAGVAVACGLPGVVLAPAAIFAAARAGGPMALRRLLVVGVAVATSCCVAGAWVAPWEVFPWAPRGTAMEAPLVAVPRLAGAAVGFLLNRPGLAQLSDVDVLFQLASPALLLLAVAGPAGLSWRAWHQGPARPRGARAAARHAQRLAGAAMVLHVLLVPVSGAHVLVPLAAVAALPGAAPLAGPAWVAVLLGAWTSYSLAPQLANGDVVAMTLVVARCAALAWALRGLLVSAARHPPTRIIREPQAWRVALLVGLGTQALAAVRPQVANDLWIHLRMGLDAVARGGPAHHEVYSSLTEGLAYVPHEWLAQVAFHLARLTPAGDHAFTLVCAGAALAGPLAFGSLLRGSPAPRVVTGSVLAAGAVLIQTQISARPHLAGLVLTPLFIVTLERWKAGGGMRGWWLLPPLVALWANCHGSFVLGIGVVGAYAVGSVVDRARGDSAGGVPPSAKLFGLAAACALASLANPVGWGLWEFVFSKWQGGYYHQHVLEWVPALHATFRNEVWQPVFLCWLVLLALGLLAQGRRASAVDWILAAAAALHTLRSARFCADLAVLTTPALARGVALLVRAGVGTAPRRHVAAAGALCLALSALGVTATRGLVIGGLNSLGSGLAPVVPAEVQFLKSIHARGNIFNHYDVGAFIISELHPDVRVGMDSRNEVYPLEVFLEYRAMEAGGPALLAYLDRHSMDMVLWPAVESPPAGTPGVLATLRREPSWVEARRSATMTLFLRRSAFPNASVPPAAQGPADGLPTR